MKWACGVVGRVIVAEWLGEVEGGCLLPGWLAGWLRQRTGEIWCMSDCLSSCLHGVCLDAGLHVCLSTFSSSQPNHVHCLPQCLPCLSLFSPLSTCICPFAYLPLPSLLYLHAHKSASFPHQPASLSACLLYLSARPINTACEFYVSIRTH